MFVLVLSLFRDNSGFGVCRILLPVQGLRRVLELFANTLAVPAFTRIGLLWRLDAISGRFWVFGPLLFLYRCGDG